MTLSIVIPCYNHGAFLEDALSSLPPRAELDYEVLIVDDGSTDPATLAKYGELREKGFRILSHANRGLAYTRNAGIASAAGKYILPLDADNKVITAGLLSSIALLDTGQYDIVYGKPSFFGEDIPSREFRPKPFDGDELFIGNYIDACAVYKKEVWAALGGYDENMPFQGNEDWEFWLHAFLQGFRFGFLDEYCYEYRVSANSMFGELAGNERQLANQRYVTNKYYQGHLAAFAHHFTNSKIYQHDQRRPLRTAIKYLRNFFFHD